MSRAIHIHAGPSPSALIEAAIRDAGATLTNDPRRADGLVWNDLDPESLRKALSASVRWVQLPSAGVETWDRAGLLDEARTWTSAGPAFAQPVAEHALALTLALMKDLHVAARASGWGPLSPRLVSGKTALILGAGRIGGALINLLRPFGVDVLAITRSGSRVDGARASGTLEDLDRFLPEADIIVVAVPQTAETDGLIGARELARMGAHTCIVNVSRGRVVDTVALSEALSDGHLGGAALDTTDPEPLPDSHELWQLPNVLITPHVACPPGAATEAVAQLIGENVRRFLDGREMLGKVDASKGY